MAKRRKIGEKPQVRQPLKIDKLPAGFHREIQEKRASGWTWTEIESDSQTWKELWKSVDDKTKSLFPGLKLPHSNLSRWYDLRVEQVKAETMVQAERARTFAESFAKREMKDMPAAVTNAIGDLAFSLLEVSDEKNRSKVLKVLNEYGWLLAQQRKLDLDTRKVEVAEQELKAKIEQIAKKVSVLKESVEKKKVDPKELGKKLDEIYGLTS
jgi:ribosomal protein S8